MEKNDRQTARAHLVTAMLAGQSWQEIAAATAMPVKRAMAYRLVRAVRIRGKVALQDSRHGHPSKLRGEVRTWVETFCRDAQETPSREVQALLQERFHLSVSISQINRLRTALGVGNHPRGRGKNLDAIPNVVYGCAIIVERLFLIRYVGHWVAHMLILKTWHPPGLCGGQSGRLRSGVMVR